MSDLQTILKVISTNDSQLSKLPIKNGQLIFAHDKQQIYLDVQNKRTCYEQIVTLNTEEQRTSLLAPIDGFYFIMETAILWRYSDDWIQITSQPAKQIVLEDSYLKFPVVGNENQIYIDTTENATYHWDEQSVKYYCIGRDYMNVKVINGGSA